MCQLWANSDAFCSGRVFHHSFHYVHGIVYVTLWNVSRVMFMRRHTTANTSLDPAIELKPYCVFIVVTTTHFTLHTNMLTPRPATLYSAAVKSTRSTNNTTVKWRSFQLIRPVVILVILKQPVLVHLWHQRWFGCRSTETMHSIPTGQGWRRTLRQKYVLFINNSI